MKLNTTTLRSALAVLGLAILASSTLTGCASKGGSFHSMGPPNKSGGMMSDREMTGGSR